ncbi:hypothetical protein [Rubneribacter badeniensis]|uniref:hypothetical protein n=1 Tax=Rubneribacter badeniensis TaxID=2070688 RepID=UPI003A952781
MGDPQDARAGGLGGRSEGAEGRVEGGRACGAGGRRSGLADGSWCERPKALRGEEGERAGEGEPARKFGPFAA